MIVATDMLDLRQADLDELFRHSPAGEIPRGQARGTVVFAPHTIVGRVSAKLAYAIAWQGKVFAADTDDLLNVITPFHVRKMRAEVYEQVSWLDGAPCIVLDYSKTSFVAQKVRDEIREVDDGVYLGLVFWGKRQVLKFILEFPQG